MGVLLIAGGAGRCDVRQLVHLVRRHTVLDVRGLWRRVHWPFLPATRFDFGEGLAGRLEDRLATGHLAPAADDHVAVGAVSRQCSRAQSSTRVDGRLLGLQRLACAEDRLGAGHNQRQRQHDDGSFPRVERLVHALVIPPDDDSEQRHGEQRLARKAERAE